MTAREQWALAPLVRAALDQPVADQTRAVAWCEYLQGHARRLYASVTDQARVADALLAAQRACDKHHAGA